MQSKNIIWGILFFLCFLGTSVHAFKLGIENLSPYLIRDLKKRRVALVTNQTGIDQKGIKTLDILTSHGITVSALCAPEHGITGTIQAEKTVEDTKDKGSALSVFSLYKHGAANQVSEHLLKSIDTFVFDIQDAGIRHYTYISTLFYLLQTAATHKKEVVVLDRPNPLGRVIEGPITESSLQSFISIGGIPLRHGMTVAELALYFNKTYFDNKVALTVVPMSCYPNDAQIARACRMKLSPNIQSLQACYGYSFLGLLGEVRPFDVGIGTSMAFQCITMPQELCKAPQLWSDVKWILHRYGIASAEYTYYSTRKKKQMVGLRISISDIKRVPSYALVAALVQVVKKHRVPISFSPSFDKAVGSSTLRACFEKGITCETRNIKQELEQFYAQARCLYRYTPSPRIYFLK